jgi:hypothetical protein
MFFTFPEHARWNAESQAVEFGVEIGERSSDRHTHHHPVAGLSVSVPLQLLLAWCCWLAG